MSNLGSLETLIEKAQAGKVEYAREVVSELAIRLYKEEPIPQKLKDYIVPLLFQIADGVEPKKALNLVGRGAPSLSIERKWEIVEAVIKYVADTDESEEAAFNYLSDDDNPEHLGLSSGRIRDVFYENINGYLNVFSVCDGRYRDTQLSNIKRYLETLQVSGTKGTRKK